MAGFKRPSFLKRQKEQQRLAKQAAKREARRDRKRTPLEEQRLVPLEVVLGEGEETAPTEEALDDSSDG